MEPSRGSGREAGELLPQQPCDDFNQMYLNHHESDRKATKRTIEQKAKGNSGAGSRTPLAAVLFRVMKLKTRNDKPIHHTGCVFVEDWFQ
jgi:hypothetical protein